MVAGLGYTFPEVLSLPTRPDDLEEATRPPVGRALCKDWGWAILSNDSPWVTFLCHPPKCQVSG